jgi:hypothetical protein
MSEPIIVRGEVSPKLLRLICYLIIKSSVDLIIIGAFAVAFYYSAFNPYYRGWLDEAGPQWIRGWAVDLSKPDTHPEVQLYIDDHFAQSHAADFPHPNLVTIGLTKDERHGFFFYTPPLEEGEHEARVYVVHVSGGGERRTLEMIGRPLRFNVDAAPAEPYFRGWLDIANVQVVRGWVVDRAAPGTRVEVHLYMDGSFVESRPADYPRPDLKAGGLFEDERHGFLFFTPPLVSGEHEARVYAVQENEPEQKRTLRLIGRPVKFTVEPNAPASPRVNAGEENLRP